MCKIKLKLCSLPYVLVGATRTNNKVFHKLIIGNCFICHMIFVPEHVGVCGNERADRLAGMATVSDGVAVGRNDILNALTVFSNRRVKGLRVPVTD
uniref:RNase H type-1 domain-containing protein n=1 Tax=Arion vulgaris TaxID=1028688 RepID=A0A0B7AVT4_9EUPU